MNPENPTKEYVCRRTPRPPAMNGRLDSPAWQRAERSPRFVDMVSGEPAFFGTQAAALWDDEYLYVGFWIEEPFVRARLTERDSLIFQESDVEVFIDGGDCYYEFEINALGTIYEVFFIWQDAFARFDAAEWDVLRRTALTFGGDYDRQPESFWRGTHPRGLRWAFLDYDMPGLRWATHVDGVINDDSVVDKGWTGDRISLVRDEVAGERTIAAAERRGRVAGVLWAVRGAACRGPGIISASSVDLERAWGLRHAPAGTIYAHPLFRKRVGGQMRGSCAPRLKSACAGSGDLAQ